MPCSTKQPALNPNPPPYEKNILAKAVRLADKSRVRPEKVIVAKPTSTLFVKKPAADMLSERLYVSDPRTTVALGIGFRLTGGG